MTSSGSRIGLCWQRVFTVVAFLGLVTLGTGARASGSDSSDQHRLKIRVESGEFGRVATAELALVLQSAGEQVWQQCPDIDLDGIEVYRRSDHSQTDFKRNWNGRIRVGLTARDTYWTQYSFQFAHEFVHVLALFGNNHGRSRAPNPANLWLEESLGEANSLFTLESMSRSWKTAPLAPAWADYAPNFDRYVQERLTAPEHLLPQGINFQTWFRQHEAALRQNATLFDQNAIIAQECLPLFKARPDGWRSLAYLNSAGWTANESLADHLAHWQRECPSDLRPFVAQLAALFGVEL